MYNEIKNGDYKPLLRNEDECLQFLHDLKWKEGFQCRRCGHKKCWRGRTRFHSRCTKCDYDESVTANTIFHKIQFSLLKAFTIVYYVTEFKKGVSCRNLAKNLNIGVKAVWHFKRKVQEAMGGNLSTKMAVDSPSKSSSIDGIIFLHRKKGLNGLQKVRVEMQKSGSGKNKNLFVRYFATNHSGTVEQCSLEAGRYVKEEKEIRIWNLRTWLMGTHHHCSDKYLQGYLDEFSFRLTHRNNKRIWYDLIETMIFQNRRFISGTGPKGKIVV